MYPIPSVPASHDTRSLFGLGAAREGNDAKAPTLSSDSAGRNPRPFIRVGGAFLLKGCGSLLSPLLRADSESDASYRLGIVVLSVW